MFRRFGPVLVASACLSASLFAACSADHKGNSDGKNSVTARSYPVQFKDDQYDLEKMTLAATDVPDGFSQKQSSTFDNEAWAAVVGQDDPSGKKKQLDSQGRLMSAAKIFSWDNPLEHLGKTYQITSQSTLYVSVDAAMKSMKLLCDLPIDEKKASQEIKAATLADETTVLIVSETLPNFGVSKDSIVCVRTGRIVNAIVESGLDGTQDILRTIGLAKLALAHVDAELK